jgi:hypothetical protein
MKRFLSLALLTVSILGSSIVTAAACPHILVTADGTECRLVGQTDKGSCAYDCS